MVRYAGVWHFGNKGFGLRRLIPSLGVRDEPARAEGRQGGIMAKTWVVICHRWRLHGVRPCRFLPRGVLSFYIARKTFVYTLTSKPFKGICLTAALRNGNASLPSEKPTWTWEFPDMKKKSVASAESGGRHLAALESNILAQLLPLVEHMGVTRYDDGDARLTGWVTIKTQGAAWVVQVKDPDSGNSFTVVDASLDKALETASLMLACDEAPWSPDPFLKAQGAKKKK